jgi:hypothetical protein
MPWMGVGVYLPPAAAARPSVRSVVRAGFSAFGDDFVDFFAALLRAAGFFAAARFFMPRTLQPARSAVNAPADAAARR